MSDIKINLKCSRCGSERFEIPSTRNDDDVITCAGCGSKGRYGDVVRSARAQAKEAIQNELKSAFKKAGFKTR